MFQLGSALLDACVLAVISKGDTYGYLLTQNIRNVIEVSESTLYPVLRRLQAEQMLVTYDSPYNGRNRRYYQITPKGREHLEFLQNDWGKFRAAVEYLILTTPETAPAPDVPQQAPNASTQASDSPQQAPDANTQAPVPEPDASAQTPPAEPDTSTQPPAPDPSQEPIILDAPAAAEADKAADTTKALATAEKPKTLVATKKTADSKAESASSKTPKATKATKSKPSTPSTKGEQS